MEDAKEGEGIEIDTVQGRKVVRFEGEIDSLKNTHNEAVADKKVIEHTAPATLSDLSQRFGSKRGNDKKRNKRR